MPDISMCDGEGCPLRENCYRHVATPTNDRQAWMETPPNVVDECEYQIPLRGAFELGGESGWEN